uniref:BTB domain-containing protein n=1 Tax=Strongyloides papillosus TaxID=174720 RepID=A0A0N5B3Y0_STREA
MDQNRKRKRNDEPIDGSCNVPTKTTKFDYTFSIENFSHRLEETGEKIESPTFVVGWKNKSEWCLSIYPNGYREESKGYVSVFLVLLKADKAKAKFKLSILNNKGEEKNVYTEKNIIDFVTNGSWGSLKFVKKDFLLNESNGLLVNDKLTIFCEAEIIEIKSENHDNSRSSLNVTIPQSQLSLNYGNMFNSSLFTDSTIKVGSTQIKVHKAVLAARSSSFHDIFNCNLRESRADVIEIEDFRVEVVKEMLRYIYTDEVSDIRNMASELFVIAVKYKLDRLKAISEHYMCNTLTFENVFERFSLSETYSTETLKESCKEFILENAGWLTKTEEWREFLLTYPFLVESLFLKSLNISSAGSI